MSGPAFEISKFLILAAFLAFQLSGWIDKGPIALAICAIAVGAHIEPFLRAVLRGEG